MFNDFSDLSGLKVKGGRLIETIMKIRLFGKKYGELPKRKKTPWCDHACSRTNTK